MQHLFPQTMTCTDRLALLPDELLLRVFALLQPIDVVAVLQTCRNLNRVAGDFRLWFNVYDNESLPLPPKRTIEIEDARNTISEAHLLARHLNQSGNSRSRRPPSFRFVDDIVNPYDKIIYGSYLVSGRYLVLAFSRSRIIRCYDISEVLPTIVCECPLVAGIGTPSFLCPAPSSLDEPASDGWIYLPLGSSSTTHVYRLALPSFSTVGPALQFFTQFDHASLFPTDTLCEYIPLMMAGSYHLFSPTLNQTYELPTEIQHPRGLEVFITPKHAILWGSSVRRTTLEAFLLPDRSTLPQPNTLNVTHRVELPTHFLSCMSMRYLGCDSNLLLTTETADEPYSSEGRSSANAVVFKMDFQDDGRLWLKELHRFPLRSPCYLLRASSVIKQHGLIFLIFLKPHTPHYIVLSLQCDATGENWEFEFKKESMAVLRVDRPYSILCNAAKGELLWIDKNTTTFRHRLIDETQ
ncbi:hypothetical protein ONZ45_g18607 [Pleurotus djamor]|nr:hypothetical protein ONZ45_g18607 [Pleurotus djamor]